MDENKTLTITQKDLMDAMLELATNDDSKLKELVDHMPMMMLLFPIIGMELWDELEKQEQERLGMAASALKSMFTEDK